MANRYWVGGTAAWDNVVGTKWSATSGGTGGASVPTTADDVFIDTGSGFTVTIQTAQANCASLTISAASVTLAGNLPLNIQTGGLTVAATAAWTHNNTINFNGANPTITTNNVTIGSLTININNGCRLGSTFTHTTTGTFLLNAGTMTLNGFDFNAGVFSSNNSSTRAIAFGTNNINILGTSINCSTATGFSYTGTGGFVTDGNTTRTLAFATAAGGSLATAPNLKISGGSTATTVASGGWWGTLDFTGYTGLATAINITANAVIVGTGMTWNTTASFNIISASQTITCNNTYVKLITINAPSLTWNVPTGLLTLQLTLTAGTLNLNGNDITMSIFSSDNSNTRSVTFGSNKITIGSYGGGVQGNVNINTATNFTYTASGVGGFYFNDSGTSQGYHYFGTTAGGVNANSPPVYVTGAAKFNQQANTYFGLLDISGFSGQMTNNNFFFASWNMGTAANLQTISPAVITQNAPGTITGSGGTTIPNLTINHTGTTTLGGPLTLANSGVASKVTLTSGTLDLNGFDLSCYIFSSNNANTRSIKFGAANIYAVNVSSSAAFDMADLTNFTCTYTTGGLGKNSAFGISVTVGTAGASLANAPNFKVVSGSVGNCTFTSGCWFNKLDIGNYAVAPSAATTINLASLVLGGAATSIGQVATGYTFNFLGTGTLSSNYNNTNVTGCTVNINHTGTTTLTGASNLGYNTQFNHISGTLALAGYALTIGIYSGSGTTARAITFGTGTIALSHLTAGTQVLDIGDATNFSCTTSATGGFTAAMSLTRTFGTTGVTTTPVNLFINSGASVPTINSGSYFNLLDFTGSTCTPAATQVNVNSLTLAGGTYTGLALTTIGTGTIQTNGKTIAAFVVNNGAGTTTFAAAVSCTTYDQTAGTINFATFNLTCSSTATFTAGTLNNTGTITCTTWTVQGTFTMSGGTITPSTSFVITSGAFNYNAGTLSAVPTFTHTAGTVTLGKAYALTATGTYTLTAGTLALAGFNLTTGIFSSTNSNTRSISFGTGNIILAHTTAGTTVLSMDTATGFTYTGTGGFTTDASITRTLLFGTTAGGSVTNSPNISLTGSGTSAITFTTGSYFNTLNFGTTAFTVPTTSLNLNGLTLSSGGTFTNLSPTFIGTGTFTTNSKTVATIVVNNSASSGTVTVSGTVNGNSSFTMTSGTINFATNNLTITGDFTYTAGSILNLGTLSCGTYYVNGTFTMTNGNISPTIGFVLTSGAFNYNGGTLTTPVYTQTAGTTTLGKALTTSGTYTLTSGTLNLNGFDLTCLVFSSSNTNTRAINFGSNNIILTGSGGTVLDMSTITNYTSTDTGGGFSADTTLSRSYDFGSSSGSSNNSLYTPNLTFTGTGSVQPIFVSSPNSSVFKNVNFGTTTFTTGSQFLLLTGNLTLSNGNFDSLAVSIYPGVTGNCTISSIGSGTGGRLYSLNIATTGSGTLTLNSGLTVNGTTTFTNGTLILNNFNLTTGIFYSPLPNTRSINFGTGNIVLTASGGNPTVLDMTDLTNFTPVFTTGGFSLDSSASRTLIAGTGYSSGTPARACNLTITGTGTSATVISLPSFPYFAKLDMGTTAATISGGPYITGLVLSSAASLAGAAFIMNSLTNSTISGSNTTLPSLTINPSAGVTISLLSAVTLGASSTFTLTTGTLDLGGFTLTTGIFSSNNQNTRSISFGSNNITLTGTGTVLDMTDTTGFTYTGTGGFSSAMSTTKTFTVGTTGGSTTNAPNLSITSGASVPTFTAGSWFKALNFTGSTCTPTGPTINAGIYVDTLTLATGGTYTSFAPVFTRTQTWTSQFSKQLAGIGFNLASGTLTLDNTQTYTTTSTLYLVNGTIDLGGTNLTIGRISSNNTNTRSISFGTNNIILNYATAATVVMDMLNLTGFSYTGTGGFTTDASVTRTVTVGTSGGVTTANAPNLTLTGSGTSVVTITTNSWFNTLNFGTTAYTLNTATVNLITVTLSTGGTFTGLTAVMFGTGSIRSNTKTIAALTINGVGITTTLNDALSLIATGTTTLTNGTLALNGFNLTTGIFSSTNANTRSITFGSNNIILAHTTAAQTVLNMATATNFTYTGSGGFVSDASVTRTFVFGTTGGSATISPLLTFTGSGTAVQTFTSGSWFNTITFGTVAFTIATTTINLNNLSLTTGMNYTGLTASMVATGTITSNTNTTLGGLNVNIVAGTVTLGDTFTMLATGTATITNGTLALNGFNLTTGIFSSTVTTTRAISFGSNNIVLAHTTAATTVLSFANSTGFTWTGTGGFTTDASITRTLVFGTTGGSATISPNLTLTGSGTSILTFTTGSWFNILNFGTTAFNPGTTNLNLNGLTLSTGGTFSTLTASMRGTGTITSNGNSTLGALTINNAGFITTLGDAFALATNATTTMTLGTLTLNGFNLTTGIFSASTTGARTINFGSNNIILNHTTAGTTVLNVSNNGNCVCTGTGGFTTDASITRTITTTLYTAATNSTAPNVTLTGSGTSIITFTTGSWFNKLDFGTTAFNPGTTALNLGSLTLSATGTYSTMTPTFVSTGTIIGNGNTTIAALTVAAVTGTTSLGAAFALVNTGIFTLSTGTLNLNGYDLTTGTFVGNGNNTTRSITFGSNNIILVHPTAGTTVLDFGLVGPAFTWTGTGGFVTDASITRTVTFGTSGTYVANSTNAPNLTFTGSGTAVITITTGTWWNKLDFGTTAFTVSGTTINLNSLRLSTGGTFTALGITTRGTGTITSNGKPISALIVNTVSGTTTLADALSFGLADTLTTLTSGTLDLAGFTLTTGTFSASGTSTRAISFGTGNIILAASLGLTTVLNIANATGFTYTGTGGFTSAMTVTRTFVFGTTGGSATNAPNLTLSSGSSIATLTTGSWFNKLDFGTTAFTIAATSLNLNGLTLSATGIFTNLTPTFVGTGTLTSNANTTLTNITINSTNGTTTLGSAFSLTATGTATLTSGTLALGGFNLTTGIFSATGTSSRTITFGTSNIVLAHTTAATTVLSIADATNFACSGSGAFTTDASITRTLVFGTTSGSYSNSPNVTLTGSGTSVITFTSGSYFNKIDFGTTTFTPPAATLNLNAFTLSTGGTYTNFTPTMVGTGVITTNGKSIPTLTIDNGAASGTTTLGGAVTTTTSTTLTSGTLALAGYTLTPTQFISGTAATRAISGAGNGLISLSNDWTVTDGTGFTGSDYTINMTKATAKTFAGAGGSYGTLVQAGAGTLTISGSNSFADLQSSTRPSTISFTSGTTQTVTNFSISGSAGSIVTINSTSPGSRFTLYKTTGTVRPSYLTITDSAATGGAIWDASNGTNISGGNNTGWLFTTVVAGQFMAFF
jgi:hypothetical protein